MKILLGIAAYLAAGFITAVWTHFQARPIDRPPFTMTLIYCMALWWFILIVSVYEAMSGGWARLTKGR